MQLIVRKDNACVLRFDKNEDVIQSLSTFCKRHKIPAGSFTGLGACQKVVLSYYDLESKRYLDKNFNEDLEIASLIGNVAQFENSSVIHAHGIFSDRNYQTYGGHVKELVVSATCEIHLHVFHDSMERHFDNTTGLKLLTGPS